MKILLVILCLLSTTLFTYAQGEKEETARDVLCEMSSIQVPRVANLKAYCTRLYALFPSPIEIAKHPIRQKLYLNKLRGVLKRGQTWERMSVQQRGALAKQTADYVIAYYQYEAGSAITRPETFKQVGDPCLLRAVAYLDLDACYADNKALVLESITDAKLSKIEKFWNILHYLARKLDCDQSNKSSK